MAPYTLLYVDDEPDLLVLGKAFLETIGDFVIDTRESAIDGLEALRTRQYDAVISDYLMPGMDGLVFLKSVREEFGTLPFILFTGRGREDVVIEAINSGVDFYLQKGGDVKAQFAELSHKIRMAVEKKRAVDERIESEKRLSSIFHASPIHQVITEFSTGKILDINDRFLHDLKLSRGEVIGRTMDEIGLYLDVDQYSAMVSQLEREGMVRNAELLVRARNDRTYTTLTSLTRVRVHNQDLIYTQSMDITVQKKSQQTINALLNAPPDVSLLLDTHGIILAANHAASLRFGQPVQDLLGMDAYVLISPDLSDLRKKKVEEAIATKKPLVYVDDRTGQTYENHLYPVTGPGGNVVAVAVHSHDITDERKAKEALRESEEKYRLVVEHSHDSIYIYRNNRFLFINRQAEELSGFSHEELMARDLWDFIHPEDRERLKSAAARRFAGGHVSSSFRARILRKNGEVREGEFYVDLIDFLGRPAILGIARDITEKKRAEDAIREREEQLRSLSDNLPSGMVYQIIIEPDGQRRFAHISAGVADIHEVTAAAVLQDPSVLYNQIIPEDQVPLKEAEDRAFRTLSSFSFETRIQTPSGRERWVLIRSAPRTLPGGGTIWDGIELDITAAKLAEDELKAAYDQLAASQEELKGQFDALATGQELLLESEEKYRTLVEHTAEGVFIAQDGNLVFTNTAFAALIGYRPDEILGRPFPPLIAPEDREMVLQRHHVRTAGNPVPEQYEFSLLHKDGTTRMRVQIRVGKGTFQGRPATLGTLHDITDEEQQAAALARSEELHRKMVAALPDIIVRSDLEGRIIFINGQGALLATGSEDPSGILGKPMFSFFAPESLPEALENTRLMFERPLGPKEYTFIAFDGRRILLEANGDVLRTPEGTPYGMVFICRDISERKQAEIALRESEEKYRRLIHSTFDAVVIYRDGRIELANDAAARIAGLVAGDDLVGKPILSFIHPDSREDILNRQTLMSQSPDAVVPLLAEKFLDINGAARDVEVMASSTRFEGKQAILVIFRDITDRKRRETALHESELRYRSILDNLQDAYFRADTQGKLIMVNPSAARIFRYGSVEEIIGIPVMSLYRFPRDREAVLTILKKEGRVVDYTGEAVRSDGTAFFVSINVQFCRDESGNILGTEGIVRDISERKIAEEALRSREQDYRLIIENMQDVFYRINREGFITMISPYGARLVGFDSPDEIIGKYRATDFYPNPDERDEFLSYLQREGKVTGYPLTLRDRHGELHYATASSRLLFDAEGKADGSEGILHDVTHLKRVENALRQANRQITLMARITRHDIHNQLMALGSWLELSRASVSDPDRMLELITREQQIASVIEEQINFTMFFDEMGVKEPAWQDPVPLIEKAQSALPFRNIRLDVEISELEIFSDPLFEKVFYNLFDNALRYGGDTLTTIRVSAQTTENGLLLAVADNGTGIVQKDKGRLFDHGFGKNTGLGLFLVREILSLTGIRIRETGTPGNGARFEMLVPKGSFRQKPSSP